jgi:prevent-host-death family protein
MKKASITETKNNLSALIDGLRGGSPVLIVDRGRPVARLEPVAGREDGGQDGRLSRLVRDGALRSRRTGPPAAPFSAPPPRANASAVELLINERREGR